MASKQACSEIAQRAGEALLEGERAGGIVRDQRQQLELEREAALVPDEVVARDIKVEVGERRLEEGAADLDLEVLREVPADEAMAVADAARELTVGVEEKARRLEPPAAEREVAGADQERLRAGVGAKDEGVDAAKARSQPDVDEVRVEDEADALGARELVTVFGAEPRRAHAVEGRLDQRLLAGEEIEGRLGGRQVEDFGCGLREGIEIRLLDRPGVERVVRRRLEVPAVEGPGIAAPVVGGSSEIAEPAGIERIVGKPDDLALIERLRRRDRARSPPPSIKATRHPRSASPRASVMPAGPAPQMQTSNVPASSASASCPASSSMSARLLEIAGAQDPAARDYDRRIGAWLLRGSTSSRPCGYERGQRQEGLSACEAGDFLHGEAQAYQGQERRLGRPSRRVNAGAGGSAQGLEIITRILSPS